MEIIDTYFGKALLKWHDENPRNMPWKLTKNPYHIWVSEIILQQTRVKQGTKYFLHFIARFPTIQALADAPQSEVMKQWEGLGYYSRARNMHATAQDIVLNFHGEFPNTYNDILSLKGIGPYTAAAIASFAYDLPHAVIDGNVNRVIARIFASEHVPSTPIGKREIASLLEKIFIPQEAALFNQAIMNFGALVCTPKKTQCKSCPFSVYCKAFLQGNVYELPMRKTPLKLKNRFLNFIIIEDNNKIIIEKRKENDIWQSLYQMPLLEKENTKESDVLFFIKNHVTKNKTPIFSLKSTITTQSLSHQKLYIQFWHFKTQSIHLASTSYQWVKKNELSDFAFPITLKKYLGSM